MIKYSLIVVTDNSEKYIQPLLGSLMWQMREDTELIIVDNLSNDETVPYIVGTIGYDFLEEDVYKFYIASQKKTPKQLVEIGRKVAKGKPIVVNVKGIVRKDYLYKRIYRGDE